MANKTIKVSVHGRVQGVFFRYHTKLMADSLGLSGWVRNCFDGSVEALCTGSSNNINKMAEWFHQGPESAEVEHVSIAETDDPVLSREDFVIRY